MGKYWSSGLAVLYDPHELKTWEGRVVVFLVHWSAGKNWVRVECLSSALFISPLLRNTHACAHPAVKYGVFTIVLFCISWVLRIVGSTLSLTLWRHNVKLNPRLRRRSRQYFGFRSSRAATALHVSKKNITFPLLKVSTFTYKREILGFSSHFMERCLQWIGRD